MSPLQRLAARSDGIVMKLLDVNILVEVHREDAVHHDEVKAWLEEALEESAGVAVF